MATKPALTGGTEGPRKQAGISESTIKSGPRQKVDECGGGFVFHLILPLVHVV